MFKIISSLVVSLAAASECSSWTTVSIDAPPESCCSESWDASTCNVLQNAYDAASECTIFELGPGTYCNNGYYKNVPDNTYYRNQALLKADGKNFLQWQAKDPNNKPVIKIDGWSGLQVKNANGIAIRNVEIMGPALKLDGASASSNRERVTGRDSEYNCQQYTEENCVIGNQCKWSSSHSACLGNPWAMYVGKCIELKLVSNVTVENNVVHHCTDSGIRCDNCDDTAILNNIVYGTTWWTTSASSAVVFAEAQGTGTNQIVSNVVYGNRNYLPFFLTGSLAHFGSGVEHYGEWNMYSVVDGQGVYLTRNLDFEGSFKMNDNICYDNGINGVVVHKTTHDNVNVEVLRNIVFDNGKTRKVEESRQTAGGLTINSGDYTSVQLLKDNQVSVSVENDVPYQCFGTCTLTSGSENNTYCGGSPSNKLDSSAFVADTNCTELNTTTTDVRAMYTHSGQKICAQYTPFINDANLQGYCTEPTTRDCCNCHVADNTCDTTKDDPDVCCDDPTASDGESAASGSLSGLVNSLLMIFIAALVVLQ